MTKKEFERMASEAQLKADEEAEAALESVDQIEGVLRRPSQIGNQGKIWVKLVLFNSLLKLQHKRITCLVN